MTPSPPGTWERIQALIDTCHREAEYLQRTDRRLFAAALTVATIETLPNDDDLAERVDAFVARFGRLQDTLGDKLLPAFLTVMAETPGTMIENLDRVEKLGLIESADAWVAMRRLRNRMIHEYVKEPAELVDALTAAHEFVPVLVESMHAINRRLATRFPEED